MSVVLDEKLISESIDDHESHAFRPWLWWVQIDTNCGFYDWPDWENNIDHPEPLAEALAHAAMLRADDWITRLVPDL